MVNGGNLHHGSQVVKNRIIPPQVSPLHVDQPYIQCTLRPIGVVSNVFLLAISCLQIASCLKLMYETIKFCVKPGNASGMISMSFYLQ